MTASAYGLAVSSLLSSLQGEYENGQRLASESQNYLTNKFGGFLGHWAKAVAYMGLGEERQAWRQSLAALEIGLRWRWDGIITWILPLMGIILAQEGQLQRAVEILGLYFSHPMRPPGWAEKWALLRDWQSRLQGTLKTPAYEAALERGRDLDLIDHRSTLDGGR